MNYKITTAVLALALVVALAYIIRMSPSKENLVQAKTKFVPVDSSDLKELCAVRKIDTLAGEIIDVEKAKASLRAYKEYMRFMFADYNPQRDIYGFSFGLKKIDDLVKGIRKYNKKNPTAPIVGLRVYMGRAADINTIIPDVMLMPILHTGDNLYDIDPDFESTTKANRQVNVDDPGVLNTSVPCPNRCNEQ